MSDADADPITAIEIAPPAFSTDSPTFVDIPDGTFSIPASPGQIWLLLVSGSLWSSSFLFDGPQARYLVDGVERGLGGTEAVTADRPGPWQHFYMFTGTTSPTTITFQARDAVGGTTVVENLRVVAAPLPATADPLYASADAPITFSSMTFTPAASLTVTPASPGEYLVLLLANTTESPSTSDCDTQWLDPAGAPWGATYKNPRGAWQSHLVVRRVTLGPDPATIVLNASTRATAQVQYVRVAALRLDGLLAQDVALVTSNQATIESTSQLANQLDPTLAAAPSYVVLATMRLDDDCVNTLLAERGAHFSVDGGEHVTMHAAGNCAYETTYGYVGVSRTAPSTLRAAISSGNAMRVWHRESGLVVLGVP